MSRPIAIEVCIDSLDSARKAGDLVSHGRNRFELCSSLIHGGGLTPSLGLLRSVSKVIADPQGKIMVMVRPRLGSFVYSEREIGTMLEEIDALKAEESVRGYVFGCLLQDGRVDVTLTRRLAEAAAPKEVTFHRAFDLTPDWQQALNELAEIPEITRVLTSGHGRTAVEGAQELADIVKAAAEIQRPSGPLIICPASGVNAETAAQLLEGLPGLTELHLTASSAVEPEASDVNRRGAELGFGASSEWRMDKERLTEFNAVLQNWQKRESDNAEASEAPES